MAKRISKHKLGKSFGPVGSLSGHFIFLGGLYATSLSWMGVFILALGAFVAFTYGASLWDAAGNRVGNFTYIFGFIPWGKWMDVQANFKLKLKKKGGAYVSYSSCNRSLYYPDTFFELIFIQNQQNMVLLKSKDLDYLKEQEKGFIALFSKSSTT